MQYTPEQIQSLLQQARDYNYKVEQLSARREVAERERDAALKHLVDTYGPDWQSVFSEQVSRLSSVNI